jgi:uncharacterized phage protein (TIGR02218 family)
MAFDTYEASNHDGLPIVLYRIVWGNTVWQYTSADTIQYYPNKPADPTDHGNDFLPVAISDGGLTQGGSSDNDFTVACESDLPIVALYADSPPTGPVWMTVRRKHADDPASEAPVYFVGRILNVTRDDNDAEASLRCAPISRLLKAGGLRLTWGKNCPHCVYDSGCKVKPLDHQYVAKVAAISGRTITTEVEMIAREGTFTGGFVEWDRDGKGTMEMRGIEQQVDTKNFRVLGRLPDLKVGANVNIYPGCDQTTSTCDEGFDNIDNNGGFPFMPEKSPFDGSQVF